MGLTKPHIDAQAGPDRSDLILALRQAVADEPVHDRVAQWLARDLAKARDRVAATRDRQEAARTQLERLRRSPALRLRSGRSLAAARQEVEAAETDLSVAARRATQLAAAVREHGPPGNGRAARRLAAAERAQAAREEWLEAHPVEAAWEADLAERARQRREALGRAAAEQQPEHVVRLLGRPGSDPLGREDWLQRAGAVEAYRERWRADPEDLGREYDLRGDQAAEWQEVAAALARPLTAEMPVATHVLPQELRIGIDR
jgi:hypothetical protein